MDNRRSIAIVAAFIAALMVMMAGKSCSDNIAETNKQNSKKTKASAATEYEPPQQNIPAPNPADNAPAVQEGTTQPETQPDHIDVTDLVGNVVGTIPVTTAEPETLPPEEEGTTKERSLLDEYNNDDGSSNSRLNGFAHSKSGKGNNKPPEPEEGAAEEAPISTVPVTLPEDFYVVVY